MSLCAQIPGGDQLMQAELFFNNAILGDNTQNPE
jgi:hypothetical protein